MSFHSLFLSFPLIVSNLIWRKCAGDVGPRGYEIARERKARRNPKLDRVAGASPTHARIGRIASGQDSIRREKRRDAGAVYVIAGDAILRRVVSGGRGKRRDHRCETDVDTFSQVYQDGCGVGIISLMKLKLLRESFVAV